MTIYGPEVDRKWNARHLKAQGARLRPAIFEYNRELYFSFLEYSYDFVEKLSILWYSPREIKIHCISEDIMLNNIS